MLGIFKKRSQASTLNKKYLELLQKAHALSTSNRTASDAAYAEAQAVLQQIEALPRE